MAKNYTPRATLKTFFEKNKIPTQEQFAQLINSSLVQHEDGLIKEDNEPLLLKTGPNNSQQRMISFLTSFEDLSNTSWHLDMSPGEDFNGTRINVPGLSITDANDHSRLFLKSGIRRIGIDTIQPEAHVHVATLSGSGDHSYAAQQNNISLMLGQKGTNNQGSLLLYGSEGDKKVYQRANKGSFYIDSTDGEYRFNNDNFSNKGGVLRVFEKLSNSGDKGSVILDSEGPSYFKNPVGIGTAAPVADVQLEVKGQAKVGTLLVSHDNNLITTKTWMKGGIRMSRSTDMLFLGLKDEGSNKQVAVLGWGDNDTDKLHLKFINHSTPVDHAGLDVITLDGKGNIGMTNPNPQFPLDMTMDASRGGWGKFTVNMDKSWDGRNTHATIGAGASGVFLSNPHIPWKGGKAIVRYGRYNGTSSGHYFDAGIAATGKFAVTPNSSTTVGLFVGTNGYTGINQNNPAYPLDMILGGGGWRRFTVSVEDNWGDGKNAINDSGNKYVTIGGGASGIMFQHPHVSWRDDRATVRYGRYKGIRTGHYFDAGLISTGNFRISPNASSTVGVFIKSNGFTGINKNNPARPLHVMTESGSGNRYAIRLEHPSQPSNFWDIGVDNDANGVDIDLLFGYRGRYIAAIDEDGTYQKGSDRALKKNIKALPPTLSKVMKLRPCTYQYKASESGKTSIGMIAQEVEKYFPQMVRKKEFYTLDYNGFGVIAIKAIQEQQEQIIQLQKEVKEMKKSIG